MSEPTEHEYKGPERRRSPHLTDELIEEIAERAAARAVEKLTDHAYRAVGKSVVEKLFWIVGVLCAGGYMEQMRLTVGVDRCAAPFTPTSGPFPIS